MWSTLALFVILAPSPAPAQTVANSFEELRHVLKKGQTVRTFTEGTVTEIRATDPVSTGALIGAGIDALVNRGGKVLYGAPRRTRRLTISPVLVLGKDRQAALVSVRF